MHDHAALDTHRDPAYKTTLIICAALNLAMFFVEGGVGLTIGSAALIADAADFLEDAVMYTLGAVAVGWSAKRRGQVGFVMGITMLAIGLLAVEQVIMRLIEGGVPDPAPLGATALLALAVNLYCARRLMNWRTGDSGMRAIWLSTRNDAILNVATIIAAVLIAVTASAWPDIVAGLLIASINLIAAVSILAQAVREMKAAG